MKTKIKKSWWEKKAKKIKTKNEIARRFFAFNTPVPRADQDPKPCPIGP